MELPLALSGARGRLDERIDAPFGSSLDNLDDLDFADLLLDEDPLSDAPSSFTSSSASRSIVAKPIDALRGLLFGERSPVKLELHDELATKKRKVADLSSDAHLSLGYLPLYPHASTAPANRTTAHSPDTRRQTNPVPAR